MASVGGTKVIQRVSYCLSPLSLAKTERLFNQPEEIFSKILKLLVGSYFFCSDLIAQIVDEQDKMQRTPLFLAAKYNHLEVVQILVRRCRKSYLNFEYFESLPFSGAQSCT